VFTFSSSQFPMVETKEWSGAGDWRGAARIGAEVVIRMEGTTVVHHRDGEGHVSR